MLIAVIEDNTGDVLLVRTALRKHGIACDFRIVADGEEAIQFVETAESDGIMPDLFLLDLNLPKRSGDEVLRKLRSGIRGSRVPVIIMTSSDSKSDREQMQALGANAYFRKAGSFDGFMRLGDLVQQVMQNPLAG